MLADYGWGSDQFSCLDSLWQRESNWNPQARNPYSGAYGIPQALPGEKMASAGSDWQTNPATQIKWGLGYIKDRYGSPCAAWEHSQSVGWYNHAHATPRAGGGRPAPHPAVAFRGHRRYWFRCYFCELVIASTSSASSNWASVSLPWAMYPRSITTWRIVFRSASACLATLAASS